MSAHPRMHMCMGLFKFGFISFCCCFSLFASFTFFLLGGGGGGGGVVGFCLFWFGLVCLELVIFSGNVDILLPSY